MADELRAASADDLRALVARSPQIGARLVEAAARGGNRLAQMTYGRMLLAGDKITRDREAAFGWFGMAAHAGDPDAAHMLGRCCESGWGVAADPEQALAHYRAAARKGHLDAQFDLGRVLLAADPSPARQREGLGWHLLAARAGHARSMNVLGRFCEEGWGMPQSTPNALGWYRKAAEAGDPWARFNLGRLSADSGQIAEAVRWFRAVADSAGDDILDSIAPLLAGRPEPEFNAIATLIAERRRAKAAAPGGPKRREPRHRRPASRPGRAINPRTF